MTTTTPTPMRARQAGPLTGTISIPGDKSISHRALMLGALAVGRTTVTGLLEGHDVLATAAAMRALGARVEPPQSETGEPKSDGDRLKRTWTVDGVGVGTLLEPEAVLDMGNSGTSTRLLAGLLATHPITSFMTGDASLVRRPMARITKPLTDMGATFLCRSGTRLPMAIVGTDRPAPISYRLPVASAQVKSAILLAGLNTPGITTVIEPVATRDHTEHMLQHMGATVTVDSTPDGNAISLVGQPDLIAGPIAVPGDISSAAFPIVAALCRPGSNVRIPDVGLNERRIGLLTTLAEMGADITYENRRLQAGEPVADLVVRASALTGVDVPPDRAATMIDEYPILAVAAASATGTTRMRGLAELRVKESDRLSAMATGLGACGVTVRVEGDDLVVVGTGGKVPGGATVTTDLDHRIAMSFLVLGLSAAAPVAIDDATAIDTSFPGFAELINRACRQAEGEDGTLDGREVIGP
ncbi:3-phosphoshikimate 1-carboxyvinyltransferase [Fodinicurvata sp. EGI_FJ10296]|uniref:3-phosphoshikimate 1-carboxyvinyltransferase n=1 Tax=Fodinicurvata sp. EGI_FJ10296 TaxID=3231908 RepID=UPI003454D639